MVVGLIAVAPVLAASGPSDLGAVAGAVAFGIPERLTGVQVVGSPQSFSGSAC
jgi:hypothetical protein